MIGRLPTTITINGTEWAIRSDFRVALLIFQAFGDPELNDPEKSEIVLDCLYEDSDLIPVEDLEEAYRKALLYLDGVSNETTAGKQKMTGRKMFDWVQDEQMIFSAVNKIAGCEVRSLKYLHWWTFLGYFNEVGEGLFSNVLHIRQKRATGKKLEKHELEFYRKNKDIIDLKNRLTEEEQREKEELLKLLR